MKTIFLNILIFIFTICGCSKSNKNTVTVNYDCEIDLSSIDAVKSNLNGYWIEEGKQDSDELIHLDFNSQDNLSSWQTLSLSTSNKEIQTHQSCGSIVEIFRQDSITLLRFLSIARSSTVAIENLTKTKFKLDGVTYLKHKGF